MGLETIFNCPNFLDSPYLEGQVPVLIYPRNRVAQLYPQALSFLSIVSYNSQGYGEGIVTLLHMGYTGMTCCVYNSEVDQIGNAILSAVAYCLLICIIATARVSTKQETSLCCKYY
jgi:hypothetical protein